MVLQGFRASNSGSQEELKMRKRDLKGLEASDSWNLEMGQRRPPAQAARAIVSVAFSREAFERVAESAERAGRKVSEFIREAALEKATQTRDEAVLTSATGSISGPIVFNGRLTAATAGSTRVPGGVSWEDRGQGITT
jgi:hypothetical protein